jgi:hypothetical protein
MSCIPDRSHGGAIGTLAMEKGAASHVPVVSGKRSNGPSRFWEREKKC